MPATELDEYRNSLGDYYLGVNDGYNYVEYQQERIMPALEAVERGEILRLAIFMPPGEAKSDQATRAFVPWWMGKHPDKNAMVCSYSADLASDDFGAKIKERMQGPFHLKIFPKSALTRDSRSKTHFKTISGGNFFSVGYQGGITGKRLDLIVLDDLIKDWTEAESTTTQEALFSTYSGVIKDRLRPHAKIVMCAHRWTMNDVYARILELDGVVEKGGDWTVLKIPAEDPPGAGTYLWEEHHGKKHYEDFKRNDDKIWWGKFQQDPGSASSYKFKEQWLNYYDTPIKPGKYNTYMLVDPAGAKAKRSDFTSIQVWAAGQDKKLFLVDWVHDRLHAAERVAEILRLTRRWGQRQTIYEAYGFNSDDYYLTEAMRAAKFSERVYPIVVGRSGPDHNMSKWERIDKLIGIFEAGHIYLPRKFPVTLSDGKKVDLTKRFVEDEYKLYRGEGSISHEDDLDCMSRLLTNGQKLHISYYEPRTEDKPIYSRPQGISWESVF